MMKLIHLSEVCPIFRNGKYNTYVIFLALNHKGWSLLEESVVGGTCAI